MGQLTAGTPLPSSAPLPAIAWQLGRLRLVLLACASVLIAYTPSDVSTGCAEPWYLLQGVCQMFLPYVLLIMRGRIVGKIVVQSSYRAHQSFHKWILPRGSRCRKHFLHSHISGHGGQVSSVDGISIAQHKSRRFIPGERFPHLLHGPLLCGMFRHPEVQHPASLMR